MTMNDSNPTNSDKIITFSSDTDNSEYRQLAAIIVDNLLSRAVSKANEHIFNSKEMQTHNRPEVNGLDLDLFPPSIQIDLVGTRTPSPEEEEEAFDWSVSKKQYRFKAPADQQSMSIDTDLSINDFDLSERENDSIFRETNFDNKSINLDEIRDFAKHYVENVISTAIEGFNTQTTENKSMLKTSRSDNQCFESCTWITRIRQVLRQLMRSSCLCKSKEQFRQRNHNKR